jgi:hypothetical protein
MVLPDGIVMLLRDARVIVPFVIHALCTPTVWVSEYPSRYSGNSVCNVRVEIVRGLPNARWKIARSTLIDLARIRPVKVLDGSSLKRVVSWLF